MPTLRDLKFPIEVRNGDLVTVGDGDAVRQGLRLRLGFFLGEWYLDEEIGVPYFDILGIKSPNTAAVREWFREEIVETPDVDEVLALEVTSLADRTARIEFSVATPYGVSSFVEEVP